MSKGISHAIFKQFTLFAWNKFGILLMKVINTKRIDCLPWWHHPHPSIYFAQPGSSRPRIGKMEAVTTKRFQPSGSDCIMLHICDSTFLFALFKHQQKQFNGLSSVAPKRHHH
uniref:Uncharacterized protein n=1 Tax=Micrurus lemniscatus lemniscatus TaxID=129467 RepID=A0A2D4I8Y8_MICLE